MKKMVLIKSMIYACLYFIFVGAVFAQEELKTLSDDPFYQAKRQTETAKLNASFDPLERATLHTGYAEERLAEVKAVVSKGRHEFAGDLLKNYETSINGAVDEINRAQAQGRDVSEALSAVERSTTKHTEVLTDLLGKVPEEARPAIKRAIEVSKRGRNTALDRLERIQRGEIPAGKPEGVGPPGKPERPERVERPGRSGIPGGIDRPGGFGGPGGGRPGGGPPGGRGR
ncbi:MAG: hypothetical protein KG012_09155 [Deltaproteobacteria bacterium]|nr:hypothetical protein [Deltaproteobacteria bacterium]